MSMVDLLALNPHWDSWKTCSSRTCSRAKTTPANTLPAMVAFVLIQSHYLGVKHVLWDRTLRPTQVK